MWTAFFDEIYLINLDKREDRLLESAEQLYSHGIGFKRFSAVEHENGAIGLRDTMLKIFQEAIDNDYKNILVFEDDVDFVSDVVESTMNEVVKQLPETYHLVYLGCQPTRGFTHFYKPNILPVQGAFATHAVGYSIQGIREILASNLQAPIDNHIVEHIQPMNQCYAVYPLLASQRAGYSDIGKADISWKPFIEGRYEQKIGEMKAR